MRYTSSISRPSRCNTYCHIRQRIDLEHNARTTKLSCGLDKVQMEDSSERPAGVVRQSYGMHERARSVHLERCRRPVIGQAYSVETATGSQLGVAMIKIHVWSTTDGSKQQARDPRRIQRLGSNYRNLGPAALDWSLTATVVFSKIRHQELATDAALPSRDFTRRAHPHRWRMENFPPSHASSDRGNRQRTLCLR